MTQISSDQAGANLSSLIEEVSRSHEPVQIQGKDSVGVLIGEDDWRSIQETLYLSAIPGMRDSIREGMDTPLEDCSENPGW